MQQAFAKKPWKIEWCLFAFGIIYINIFIIIKKRKMIEAASTTSSDTKYIVNIEQLKSSYQVTGPGNRMNHSMGFYN